MKRLASRGSPSSTPTRGAPSSPRIAGSGTPKLRRKKTIEDTYEAGTSSRRLVEYFIVVSSLPRWNDGPASPAGQASSPLLAAKSRKAQQQQDASTRAIRDSPGDGNIRMPQSSTDINSDYTFQPKITARYPPMDYPDHALNPMVTQFCYPHSDVIVPSSSYVMPRVHHFVLTNDKGRKVYGTCLTIFEEYTEDDPMRLMMRDTIHSSSSELGDIEVTTTDSDKIQPRYIPKVLCILSTWPYLTAFREYLSQLYRLAMTTDLMKAPIERYIQNLCLEIPAPPPGAFEIHVPILSSTIRFWAPPAKLPLAYVSLPYQTLFECLDVQNILTVWYALILERKVLLLSSQHSILTVCAEVLSSLLFPMQWSHLYIPLVPRFLSPMLDAPFPYLCGVVRGNWLHAQQHVSDETIVVDLDSNTILFGDRLPQLPHAPPRKWGKLCHTLDEVAGELFWKARGIEDEYEQLESGKMTQRAFQKVKESEGDPRWKEKLSSLDEAFNLAYAPDSLNLLNDDGKEDEQSQWDKVQEAFLRFFVSLFKDYRKFLHLPKTDTPETPDEDSNVKWSKHRSFDRDGFIAWQKAENHAFVREFCLTQLFDDFITKRMYSPGEPDVIFFDQSIDAKLNRSRLKVRKVETPFLQSAKAHKQLNTVKAVAPNEEDLVFPDVEKQAFIYDTWPQEFDSSLFCAPRPIPAIITAEFDRQSALMARLRANALPGDEADIPFEFYGGDYDASPEVATFTVFFFTYSAVIGREWQEYRQKQLEIHATMVNDAPFEPFGRNEEDPAMDDDPASNGDAIIEKAPSEEKVNGKQPTSNGAGKHEVEVRETRDDKTGILSDLTLGLHDGILSMSDCGRDACDVCPEVPRAASRLQEEIVVQLRSWEENPEAKNNDIVRETSFLDDSDANALAEYEEMRDVAAAQLNLGFSALTTMALRGLSPDPDAFQSLMEACGRCGDTDRAFKLIELMKQEGLVTDSEVYASLMRAFANGDDSGAAPPPPPSEAVESPNPKRRHYRRGSDAYTSFLRSKLEQMAEDGKTERTLATSSDEGSEVGSFFSSDTDTSANGIPTPSSSIVADFYNAVSKSIEGFTTPAKPTKTKGKKKRRHRRHASSFGGTNPLLNAVVTDGVRKQIELGKTLLDVLYPGLIIDTNGDSCPQCSRTPTEDEIVEGWNPCEFQDYTTQCPQCSHRFVPRFSILSTSPAFEGSQGPQTPLYCEFLSPWVVRQELEHAIHGPDGIEGMLRPEWRSGTDIKATLWWNLVVLFQRYRLPVSYLLQGSFQNRLINPTPDA